MDELGGSRPIAADEDNLTGEAVSAGDAAMAVTPPTAAAEILLDPEAMRRDRLLAALTLLAGVGLCLALPFALQAGSEFFLPLTAAVVIAIAMVPALEWLERHWTCIIA